MVIYTGIAHGGIHSTASVTVAILEVSQIFDLY